MNPWWVSVFPLLILFLVLSQQKKETVKYLETRIRKQKGDTQMQQLALRYIGKDVLLTTVASGSYDGVLREVVDNAAVLDKNGKETVVNLDYVIRLREYPKNKNGKRKALVAD